MSTTHSGSENPTDDAPNGWRETKRNYWVHETRAIVRIRGVIPTRSAADFNAATHSEGATQYEVLFHEEQLPSTPAHVETVGTETAARERAMEIMAARP